MLDSYPALYRRLQEKTRGRKGQKQIGTSPDLWARIEGENIVVRLDKKQDVATLYPDNSMEVDVRTWCTRQSCEIIQMLTGYRTRLEGNMIWIGWRYPLEPMVLKLNSARGVVYPPELEAKLELAERRLDQITLDTMSAKDRVIYEMQILPLSLAISDRLDRWMLGEDVQLSRRDVLTGMDSETRTFLIHKFLARTL